MAPRFGLPGRVPRISSRSHATSKRNSDSPPLKKGYLIANQRGLLAQKHLASVSFFLLRCLRPLRRLFVLPRSDWRLEGSPVGIIYATRRRCTVVAKDGLGSTWKRTAHASVAYAKHGRHWRHTRSTICTVISMRRNARRGPP